MNIKNSIVWTAMVLGLSAGQSPALDNNIACVWNDSINLTVSDNITPNTLTSFLTQNTKTSVSATINASKECETDELVNLFTAFENACKDDKK